jgi:hypothetical protein
VEQSVVCGRRHARAEPSTRRQVAATFGRPVTRADGLPVEFSWPILPSTLDASDFRVTLSDGTQVTPEAAAVFPNQEYTERAVAVLFGSFGNRGARYPIRTQVVRDAMPLTLVGPGGRLRSAVGLAADASTSPYAGPRTGPRLVAAKLSRMSQRGERAPRAFSGALPNDGVSLYGRAARFRLRVFTSGGFSPDGVRAVFPTEFSRYFRLRARDAHGATRLVTRARVEYHLAGGVVRILGLADLGRRQSAYDDCYVEDKDNQIDIVLAGDERAVRRITTVEIPAAGRYDPFYNPGGPGTDPTRSVRYTAPGPAQSQPVQNALRDPRTVTYVRPR